MFKIVLLIFLCVLFHPQERECAKILGVFPFAAGSHFILDYKLMKGLADAGHDVTMVSPQTSPVKIPGNYTEIVLEGFAEKIHKVTTETNLFEQNLQNPITIMRSILETFVMNINETFNHPEVKALLNSQEKFDAVIVEYLNNDALKVLPNVLNCPLILLFSMGPISWINPSVGNPQEISYTRHMLTSGNPLEPMTFLERVKNVLNFVLENVMKTTLVLPQHQRIVQDSFPGSPDIDTLHGNASLVLLNSHTSLYPAHPLVPNMIEIGGYFIDPPKRLPEDLQSFMDNAEDGVIYFSMGSHLKSKDMPEERKRLFLKVFGKLRQKVIWKFEEDLSGVPKNVLIKKWLPQQDILAHPNIRLFITHGGLLSTTETVYHGVPILALPVFGDQPANAERAQYAGYGLQLSYHDKNFNEVTLANLIRELLTNPKYQENVRTRSRLFHDRPMKPMDAAVYWVEYVIRNNGAKHLKVASVDQYWFQYYLLDVTLFLVMCVYVIVRILKYMLIRLICILKIRLSRGKNKLKVS